MVRVLAVGIDPDEVDYTDPALPPGMTAEVVRRGIEEAMNQLRAAGYEAHHLYIPADPSRLNGLSEALATLSVDCITIGGGVRLPSRNLPLFEAVINVVTSTSRPPAVALPARPEEIAAAVARVVA